MPVILFKLRNVPDDEAEEIRELLSGHNIEFYETPAGRWGISMEAIWLKDESLLDDAKQLIDEYQTQRYQRVRQEYEELENQGQVESFAQRLANRPVQVLFYVAIILIILYFVTMPFIKLAVN
jgi:hypothetical protein